jgi:hypothetical protein
MPDTIRRRTSIAERLRYGAGRGGYRLREEASALLRHGNRRQPQHRPNFEAVAARYGL